MDASIFDSALSHTRRSDASEKKEKKKTCPLLDIFACGQVSSPRLYRLNEDHFFNSLLMRIELGLRGILVFNVPERYFAVGMTCQELFSFKVPNKACQSCVRSVPRLTEYDD